MPYYVVALLIAIVYSMYAGMKCYAVYMEKFNCLLPAVEPLSALTERCNAPQSDIFTGRAHQNLVIARVRYKFAQLRIIIHEIFLL